MTDSTDLLLGPANSQRSPWYCASGTFMSTEPAMRTFPLLDEAAQRGIVTLLLETYSVSAENIGFKTDSQAGTTTLVISNESDSLRHDFDTLIKPHLQEEGALTSLRPDNALKQLHQTLGVSEINKS